jgi:hypothetical protein
MLSRFTGMFKKSSTTGGDASNKTLPSFTNRVGGTSSPGNSSASASDLNKIKIKASIATPWRRGLCMPSDQKSFFFFFSFFSTNFIFEFYHTN